MILEFQFSPDTHFAVPSNSQVAETVTRGMLAVSISQLATLFQGPPLSLEAWSLLSASGCNVCTSMAEAWFRLEFLQGQSGTLCKLGKPTVFLWTIPNKRRTNNSLVTLEIGISNDSSPLIQHSTSGQLVVNRSMQFIKFSCFQVVEAKFRDS